MHAFSSESIPPRGLSLTHLAGKGLLVACHGHEAEKLAGMARIYIYPEPDLRPAYLPEELVLEIACTLKHMVALWSRTPR